MEAHIMTTRKSAKSKGSQFEMDCTYSLQKIEHFKNIRRLGPEGFQAQYDLKNDGKYNYCFECKFLKTITWNAAKKFFIKLEEKTEVGYMPMLIYKTNQQPVLVMFRDSDKCINVVEFEDHFRIPFIKHESTRAKKGDENE